MFYFDDFHGKKVLKSTLLKDLQHFFTTREFVLSQGELDEIQYEAEKNKDFLCDKLGITKDKLLTCNQTHSNNIQIYKNTINRFENCDGIISNVSNTAIMLNFADCIPIIIYDPGKNISAIVHAGWKGTACGITDKTIKKIINTFDSNPEDIKAAIGPGIGKCCFSTDKDVFKQLVSRKNNKNGGESVTLSPPNLYKADENNLFYEYNKEEGKYYIDLKLLNKNQLLDNGIKEIDICNYCTSCTSDLFFSYRKENRRTARYSAVIKLD